MKEIFADLHVHIGRSENGKPIKITAARSLNFANIAKECAKFKREHPEEYEKCSQMLEAIQENRLPPELGVSK